MLGFSIRNPHATRKTLDAHAAEDLVKTIGKLSLAGLFLAGTLFFGATYL